MRDGSVDFNSMLMGLNLIVVSLIVFASTQTRGNEYINQETFLLGVLLSIQTHVALLLERRRRDPFIILLAYMTIVYFSFRIFTLSLYPSSTVFERYPFGPDDSNYALIFIIIANVFLYAGLYVVKFRNNVAVSPGNWRARSPARALLLILASMIFIYIDFGFKAEEGIGRVIGILSTFVNPGLIILLALSYYWLYRKSLSRWFSLALLTMLIIEIVVHTLLSSRGVIVSLIQEFIMVILAIAGCIKVRRDHFAVGIAVLPVLFVLLIGAYTISTLNRVNRAREGSLNLVQAIALADASSFKLSRDSLEVVLPGIFNRVAFFDFSAEIIANSKRYDAVINISSYGKSIVDNILTPGFDVFDQPMASHALQFIYGGLGRPSKKLVSGNYQSDQLGLYGEFYALFGYASIPLFFLMAFMIKRIYVGLQSANPFNLSVKRVVVLVVFWTIIRSFGVDWIILNIVAMVVAILVYSFFFRSSLHTEPLAH